MCDQHALFLHACLQRHSAQTRLRHMFPQGHLVLHHIVLCCSSMTVFSMCIASVLCIEGVAPSLCDVGYDRLVLSP